MALQQPHTQSGKLSITPPYNFNWSLEALWKHDQELGESSSGYNTIRKAFMVNNFPVGFQLYTSSAASDALSLEYTLYSTELFDQSLTDIVLYRIAIFLGLEDSLLSFYDAAIQDKEFLPTLKRFYGFHPVRFLTPFESACWSILIQRNLTPIASKMRQALISNMGKCLTIDETDCWAFPEASLVAKTPVEKLCQWIGDPKKANHLVQAAKAFAHIEESWLLNEEFNIVQDWLEQIAGIGPSSALLIMIHGLGRMNQAPLTDKKLLSAIKKTYGNTVDRQSMKRFADHYGPWQGYWALYLLAASQR